MIALEKVCFSYGEGEIMHDFSLTLPPCGVCCILGASGCGKTTLLRLLAGLETPQSGTVARPAQVAYLFQENRLLPWATALENLRLVCGEQAAQAWLARVELAQAAGERPEALSGGMQRRVALARALALPSEVLLLDEPFTGMDEALRARLYPLILEAAEQKPVLLVTHERQDAQALAQTIWTASGPPLRLERG